uniref:Plastid lipid-associated protein/fibrillin conserved domain-containing protein n=1 Tax=Odontella aurita TaxID=265563 RepID=A0A7S4JGX6_9STRA|mmetsp:Transcript_46276/g.140226  ORF Transcript_46276/g.140226 Transcript_46276/m.140226 type:complete len:251 (+) Transcript_46276:156-908(+)|eukprot:CAMPEP_0113558940 /NCGR_PEP_ID=MMETSP0015_2-20120614/18625_1 /TAXON_ID=2838 /ORGANISM="Odontella" /LENGTH=250 /DNA_ID=CAMNT_0000460531 /DNA_START=161 /DNA_END=913 /DNA_ORIENTATION=- /assembly_acc=CAM_ASM_000160
MKPMLKALILLSAALATSSFIPTTPSLLKQTRPGLVLDAKSKSKNAGGGGGFGNGGGFGGGKSENNKPKTRTVSGFTGSGTKALRNAANTFDDIRKQYGKDATSDLYMRSPLNDKDTFWFVGKVVRRMDLNDKNMEGSSVPTEFEAVLSQKRLIIEYAKNELRPQNFGGPYSKELEVWLAPGDSEMEVVTNKVSLVKVAGSASDISDSFAVADVGFNPEIYVGDEMKEGGLRVVRDEDGKPVKPVFEING